VGLEVRRLSRWSWVGSAQEEPGGGLAGTYHPTKVRTATITLSDTSYALRRPWVSDTWKLRERGGPGRAVVHQRMERQAIPRFMVEPRFATAPEQLPLLVLLVVWGILLEPTFAGGGGG
jgi:hypothetical protein